MTKPVVTVDDTFSQWRVKTNTISDNVGDPAAIDLAPIGVPTPQTELVAAVNQLASAINYHDNIAIDPHPEYQVDLVSGTNIKLLKGNSLLGAGDLDPDLFTVISTTATTTSGKHILADTTSAAFTLTLPATPTAGQYVVVADGGDWSVNNLTIGRNGSTINGAASDLILSVADSLVKLVYDGTTWLAAYMLNQGTFTNVARKDTANTWTGQQTFIEIKETEYTITGTTPVIDPANGSVQIWTLTAASTPTEVLENGQIVTLFIADGTDYAITWPTTVWVGGGTAPTLATTGWTIVQLYKVGSVLYGKHVGDVA